MSDPEVPESAGHAAFAELAEVVHHVSEQLAGYRRRALSAEAQVRQLEQAVERERSVAESLQRAASRVEELEAALRAASADAGARAAELEAALAALAAATAASDESSGEGESLDEAPGRHELLALNAALQERLDEATSRTTQIVERVRFLRQQLSTGAPG